MEDNKNLKSEHKMVSLPSKVVTIMFTLYGNYTHTCESMQGDYSHHKLSMLPAIHYYPTGQVNNDSSMASHERAITISHSINM